MRSPVPGLEPGTHHLSLLGRRSAAQSDTRQPVQQRQRLVGHGADGEAPGCAGAIRTRSAPGPDAEPKRRIQVDRLSVDPGRHPLFGVHARILSASERAAIELVDLAELTPREAAAALGVSRGVLRMRLSRARARLRTECGVGE